MVIMGMNIDSKLFTEVFELAADGSQHFSKPIGIFIIQKASLFSSFAV